MSIATTDDAYAFDGRIMAQKAGVDADGTYGTSPLPVISPSPVTMAYAQEQGQLACRTEISGSSGTVSGTVPPGIPADQVFAQTVDVDIELDYFIQIHSTP